LVILLTCHCANCFSGQMIIFSWVHFGKWPFYLELILSNDHSVYCPASVTNWPNCLIEKMTKWPLDKMNSWPNHHFAQLHIPNEKMAELLFDVKKLVAEIIQQMAAIMRIPGNPYWKGRLSTVTPMCWKAYFSSFLIETSV
jgi:hypothetical protein